MEIYISDIIRTTSAIDMHPERSRVTYCTFDSTRVALRSDVVMTRLHLRFLPNDSARVTMNDSRPFLQNSQTSFKLLAEVTARKRFRPLHFNRICVADKFLRHTLRD